jgi:hypothetical protein
MTAPGPSNRAPRLGMRRLWVVGLAAAALAAVANSLIRLVAVGALDVAAGFEPFAPLRPILLTVAGVLAGTGVLALLTRVSSNPVRTFRILAVPGVLVSFIPNIVLLAADPPPFPGITGATVATLMLMHVVAAVIAVPMLTILPRTAR